MNKFDHLNKLLTPKITIFVMSISIDDNAEFEFGSCANGRFATCWILQRRAQRRKQNQRRAQIHSWTKSKSKSLKIQSMINFAKTPKTVIQITFRARSRSPFDPLHNSSDDLCNDFRRMRYCFSKRSQLVCSIVFAHQNCVLSAARCGRCASRIFFRISSGARAAPLACHALTWRIM